MKTPDIHVEQELIATLLHGADPADAKHITERSFYLEADGAIWSTLQKLHDQNIPLDETTVRQALRSNPLVSQDQKTVDRIFSINTNPSEIGPLAARVADTATRTVLQRVGYKINSAGTYDETYNVAELYDEALAELEEIPKHFAYRENPSAAPGPLDTGFTAANLMAQEFEPLEYVVPDVITEGLTLLVGPPKLGKSWMVGGIAKACTEGGLAFGAIPVDQRPVMYLALEDGQRRLQDRLRVLGMENGNDDLFMMTDTPAGAMLTIGAYLERHADRKPLVILDTLGKVRDVYAGNDAYQKDYSQMSMLKNLVDDNPGSSLLIVHHTNKGAHGDFVSSVSGTQGLAGAADSILSIERSRNEGESILNVTSRDAAEGSYAITLDDGVWTLDGTDLTDAANAVQQRKSTAGLGDDMTRLIEEVGKHPEGIGPKDLATLLHFDDSKTRLYLKRAFDEGRIARPKRGLYAPVTNETSVTIPGIDAQPDSYTVSQVTQLRTVGAPQ